MAINNQKRLSVTRLLTPVALAVVLAACSSTSSTPNYVDITSDPTQSVSNYLMQADSSEGSLQSDWLIMALKAAVESNDVAQADLLIRRLSRQPLSDMQQAEWQLARATLLYKNDSMEKATQQLNFPSSWRIADEQWRDYYQLRADIFAKQANYFEAARELTQLAEFETQAQQPYIAESIWENLTQYSGSQVAQSTPTANASTFDGWVQLARYNNTLASNIPQLKNTLEQWLADHPTHPAAIYTPQAIQDILALDITKPVNTALLLPLSGQYAKQAQLIRDGFILQMMNDELRDPSATLTVIDTNITDAQQLQQMFIEKNIDFVVGPLVKGNIEKLQQAQAATNQPLPMLALNIPDDVMLGTNICYLALSPEQEVAQAAKHLFAQGYRYPLVLAPKGRLGQRVVEAFSEEWKKYSDNKVAINQFTDKRQLQRNINTAFGLQDSQQHIAQMESLLGIQLESQPRSRRDIDAVYIVAGSAELTLIKPFIEVAINPDTNPPQLFSNSRSNSGRQQYEDLTGVMYSDIPLLIQPNSAIEAQMNQMWPKGSNAEKRLQALGMDAYLLMEQLPQMKVVNGYTIEGNTGSLSIDEHCVVQREISWAEHGATKSAE
ncbi:penicillin-binding protein activator [Vibrio renipiscarius]|uniref:Penicillin-binding protein activator LpoA n=1 Tax=Vibrio renipiscarius TaxID=1461322 RepID=A0A0C2JP77_9VIBR|nr:penicillin-binding protein activator [Vibrio renipiscarius]KII79909.1 penicillin-binding protein [Vibrio renipiscarius]KII80116.1 penicillin-binding protein [Vibrio renipiscarius]